MHCLGTVTRIAVKILHDKWTDTRGLCYIGNNTAFCLYFYGVYRISTLDRKYTKLASSGWSDTRNLCYIGENSVLVLYAKGMYKISTSDGSYSKLSDSEGLLLQDCAMRGMTCTVCHMDQSKTIHRINTTNGTFVDVTGG